MAIRRDTPELPQAILLEDDGIVTTDNGPVLQPANLTAVAQPVITNRFVLRLLANGCYFLQWQPNNTFWYRFNGTMRVERHGSGVTASGDLYQHTAYRFEGFPSFRIVPNPDPSPSAGIPIFRRSSYRYYLRVTQILEWITFSNSFVLKFERYSFDATANTWSNDGEFSAVMTFKTAPPSYPAGATYLEGDLKDPTGAAVGKITIGGSRTICARQRLRSTECRRRNIRRVMAAVSTGTMFMTQSDGT